MGIAALREDLTLWWGLFCALPGQEQSVPRAELYAVVLLCHLAAPGSSLRVFSDSKVTCDGVAAERRTGSMKLLWEALWALVGSKGLRLQLVWTKGACGY